jgi:hypothetical protein
VVAVSLKKLARGDDKVATAELDAAPVAARIADASVAAAKSLDATVVEVVADTNNLDNNDGNTNVNSTSVKKPPIKKPPKVRGFTTIKVVTDPPRGNLFVDGVFRGPDGTNIRELTGTTLKVRCRKEGFKQGTARVKFVDGKSLVVCHMKKRAKCTEGLKNPFEKCD